VVLWKCALLGGQAKWKQQSMWIWERAKNVSTCISMDHLRSSGRVLINQTDEMIMESIATAYVGDNPTTGDVRRMVLTV
jgi:hypothetical protein